MRSRMHAYSMYPWGSFQLSSVPQRQLSASARHSGTRSWRHRSFCGILADHRAPTRRRACVWEHRYFAQTTVRSIVLFTPFLGRVRRPCRGLEKFFRPVLQRCYGCSFDAQEIVHTSHGMLGCYCLCFFFWTETCLPKVSWKSNPAAPGLANQVWPFKSALYVPGKTLMVGWGLLAHASGGHLRWSVEGWACLSSFQLKGLYDRTGETHS